MPKANAWSREALDFLADHYGQIGWSAPRIAEQIPGPARTVTAIHKKAQYLGLCRAENTGQWRHSRAVHEDVYDLAVLDYTDREIADAIYEQHGEKVSPKWVRDVMVKYLPGGVYAAWRRRCSERRGRIVAGVHARRRRVAA